MKEMMHELADRILLEWQDEGLYGNSYSEALVLAHKLLSTKIRIEHKYDMEH